MPIIIIGLENAYDPKFYSQNKRDLTKEIVKAQPLVEIFLGAAVSFVGCPIDFEIKLLNKIYNVCPIIHFPSVQRM